MEKCRAIDDLISKTINKTNIPLSERALALNRIITSKDFIDVMNVHRDKKTTRWFANILSILTLIPAAFRAAKSYAQTRSLNFMKPRGTRHIESLTPDISKTAKRFDPTKKK